MQQSVNTHIGFETETIVIFVALAIFAFLVDMWAHRGDKPISLTAASLWTMFWIGIGLSFAGFLAYHFNNQVASLYMAGYLFELALSVDNLFVMMAIFAWFGVQDKFCHRVLYWGVLGAVVFRLIFVMIGSSLFALGPVVELIFAIVVGLSGVMMLKKKENTEVSDFSSHLAYRVVKRFFPIYPLSLIHI